MRIIGHLETDKDARTFADFLYVQGVENETELDGQQWAIWVHADDQIPTAAKWLEEFRAHPDDPRFLAGSPAGKLRAQARAEDAAYRKRLVPARRLFPGLAGYRFGFVTYLLIVACVVVAFLSRIGGDVESISGLFISWAGGLKEIRQGEVWRFVTPMLVHFGPMHILFNMFWLRDLGSLFEARLGSLYFVLFVLTVAVVSNGGQYLYTGHPIFGGMSGVNYGLIGYVWMRGRFDPAAGLHLEKQNLIIALIWFAACFTGWVGPIANTAHALGLGAGMAWGFLDSKRK